MKRFAGRTAVITGAASGFGLEFARRAAGEGMNVVMADVQAEALDAAAAEVRGVGVDVGGAGPRADLGPEGADGGSTGAAVLAVRVDVARPEDVQALADATLARFGVPHLLFNNAGVGAGGLVWEHTLADWQWVVGVNLMGVAHGVRVFTPLMLEAARADGDYEGHIVNTASMAGLVNMPNMGVYNVTKHAVVSLSETLFQDLSLVTTQVGASVMCPFFVPTGIHRSERYRPAGAAPLTRSQRIAQTMTAKAVTGGKMTAPAVAGAVFEAVRERRFYVYSHPGALGAVQTRLDDVLQGRNPSDPFAARPELGVALRAQLQGDGDDSTPAVVGSAANPAAEAD